MTQPRDVLNLAGRSVLVVEDAFYLAMEIQEVVSRAGGVVIGPFADATEAAAALTRQKPDTAIVDINLGAGPSFRIADALRAAEVPFVFLTGYDASTVPERFADVATLQKPANIGALLRRISEATVRQRGGSFSDR